MNIFPVLIFFHWNIVKNFYLFFGLCKLLKKLDKIFFNVTFIIYTFKLILLYKFYQKHLFLNKLFFPSGRVEKK